MKKNSISDIYILIGLLVFAIPMVLASNKDTVALGEFLLIGAALVLTLIIYNMVVYYIKKNYYRKPSNVSEQKKIEAILTKKYINEDGTYSFDKLKKMKK
jgi:amino acid permease